MADKNEMTDRLAAQQANQQGVELLTIPITAPFAGFLDALAPAFAGLTRVAQHRLVYDALHNFIARQGVHALAIEARA